MPESIGESASRILKAVPVKIEWHAGLSIFASELFLKAVGDEYGWLGGFNESGELRCVLPFTIIRKVAFRLVRFRVETIPIGVEIGIQEEKSFLNSTIDHFRSIGVDMIIPATTNTIFRTYPDGAIAAPYGSLAIDLSQPEDALWNNIHSKHRNVIRSAIKQGVQIAVGMEHLHTAFQLVRDTLRRSDLPFMRYGDFQQMILALGNNVEIMVAEHRGAPQGCAVIPFSYHAAYYVYGGTAAEKVNGAINLLQWEAIKLFRKRGVKFYDLVGVRINPENGSKQEGLFRFKQRFGGRLIQGFMWKYSFRPIGVAAYSIAMRLFRGGDIVDQERHKLADAQAPHRMLRDDKPVTVAGLKECGRHSDGSQR